MSAKGLFSVQKLAHRGQYADFWLGDIQELTYIMHVQFVLI